MAKFRVLDLEKDKFVYQKYLENILKKTAYHLPEYLLAEKSAENGWIKIFIYEENDEFALIPMVVKAVNSLPYLLEVNECIYDMITPHEYGGILSNSNNYGIKKKLLKEVIGYCKENRIIFQFIRVNPYLSDLVTVFRDCDYEVIHSCDQIYINLRQTEQEIIGDYKSNVRRNIRRAQSENLEFEISCKTEKNIEIFSIMYKKSMEILQAKKFLYFNKEYFRKLIACECSRLCFVKDQQGNVLAASILVLGNDVVYYHLGCFDRNCALKRPMNYLMHSMILWGKKMNYHFFHLGGGGKSLLQFKEGYSSSRIKYYIAVKICDENKYKMICERWKNQFPQYATEKFYPLYRYNES